MPEEQPSQNENRHGTIEGTQKEEGLKRLRTYEGDIEELVKTEHTSLAKIAVAEEERKMKKEALPLKPEPTPIAVTKRVHQLILAIFILILLGLIGFLGAKIFLNKIAAPVPVGVVEGVPISLDSVKTIPVESITGDILSNLLVKERDQDALSLSSVVGFSFTKNSAGGVVSLQTEEFLSLLGAKPPPALSRALDAEFVFGLNGLQKNAPFLVLKTAYYQSAFAGMLQWEGTMENDLGPIFVRPIPPPAIATSTAQFANEHRNFTDAVIQNRDSRVLRDAYGNTELIYSFPDQETIIITTNETTLGEITRRLVTGTVGKK